MSAATTQLFCDRGPATKCATLRCSLDFYHTTNTSTPYSPDPPASVGCQLQLAHVLTSWSLQACLVWAGVTRIRGACPATDLPLETRQVPPPLLLCESFAIMLFTGFRLWRYAYMDVRLAPQSPPSHDHFNNKSFACRSRIAWGGGPQYASPFGKIIVLPDTTASHLIVVRVAGHVPAYAGP